MRTIRYDDDNSNLFKIYWMETEHTRGTHRNIEELKWIFNWRRRCLLFPKNLNNGIYILTRSTWRAKGSTKMFMNEWEPNIFRLLLLLSTLPTSLRFNQYSSQYYIDEIVRRKSFERIMQRRSKLKYDNRKTAERRTVAEKLKNEKSVVKL